MNTRKRISKVVVVMNLLAIVLALPASAARIDVADFSFAPDGTTTNAVDITDIATPNGGNVLASSPSVVYFVTTFTFGTNTLASLRAQFLATGQQNRIGVEILNNGTLQTTGTANPNRTSTNLGTVAGKTFVLLAKLHYDVNNSDTYNGVVPGVPLAGDDTLMNVWVNPTSSSVEGTGITAGDIYALWNSATFGFWKNTVLNQSTPGSAGDSSITETLILTGADATFAKALALTQPPQGTTIIIR